MKDTIFLNKTERYKKIKWKARVALHRRKENINQKETKFRRVDSVNVLNGNWDEKKKLKLNERN